jgi:uncharacterized protein (DUF2267 family)
VADHADWWRAMNNAELLQQVQAAAALDRATAERVLLATMVTLTERLGHQELVRLRAWLPDELQAAVHAACRPASRLTPTSSSAGLPSTWESHHRQPGRRCAQCWER